MKPDTWDNVRVGGAKLKAKGHPVGIPLGHSNDPNTTWRGLLWSFGGAVQDEAGKKVVLNSKETVEAVKFVDRALQGSNDVGSAVVGRLQQQSIPCFGCRLDDHQSDLGLSDIPEGQQGRRRRHVRDGTRRRDRCVRSWAAPPSTTASGSSPRTRKARSSSSSTMPIIGLRRSRRVKATTTPASPISCLSRCRSCRTIRHQRRTTSCRSCRTPRSGPLLQAIPGRPGQQSTRSTTTSSSAT